MKKIVFTLIAFLCLNLSVPAHAVFLLDREEKVLIPGGQTEQVQVNNFTGRIVAYRTDSGWSSKNLGYIRNLQRLYDLQRKRKKGTYNKKR